ncbi:MAG: ATP/GTP-binding protein [Archaeoglobaceae archaeon]|nr:ATP/GTP-binding protein [Archaeoglobaceae archaeon]MDW8118229.1 ATP/GTP-binding protein [Archaeoglobaceae archaeon]
MQVVVLGPAGSGKSTFVKEFSNFLRNLGYDVKCVNLDPSSDPIYQADIDIRNYVRTEKIMLEYGLGVNGAMLKSIELMSAFSDKLKLDADFVLYDTPGQMEIFIYSDSGIELVDKLKRVQTCGLFLIDASMVRTPENFVSAILQNVVVMLRIGLPTVTAITKSDLLNLDVKKHLLSIRFGKGVLSEIMEKLTPLVSYTSLRYRTLKISNVDKSGYQDLLSTLRELFCACGDLS